MSILHMRPAIMEIVDWSITQACALASLRLLEQRIPSQSTHSQNVLRLMSDSSAAISLSSKVAVLLASTARMYSSRTCPATNGAVGWPTTVNSPHMTKTGVIGSMPATLEYPIVASLPRSASTFP